MSEPITLTDTYMDSIAEALADYYGPDNLAGERVHQAILDLRDRANKAEADLAAILKSRLVQWKLDGQTLARVLEAREHCIANLVARSAMGMPTAYLADVGNAIYGLNRMLYRGTVPEDCFPGGNQHLREIGYGDLVDVPKEGEQ